ncbi:uncharacterized protein FOMMEDRAFT_161651 [Fomitiporia mediterranea MF3/22]|uniref:uncharacterized protein n=1 Tax=Fomitiporia mediterranea (strain MF3/22) TaxID=694068 RepID=UPI00044093B2|nr:uncharacterized protein FOMMEDRAFT_161651 [Fomitiporia mediterranea MF3/22]EJC98812.1 hypothetical protein FOMMEDRAFT_161651 [Fomitiporia mediterranea MF3/22]
MHLQLRDVVRAENLVVVCGCKGVSLGRSGSKGEGEVGDVNGLGSGGSGKKYTNAWSYWRSRSALVNNTDARCEFKKGDERKKRRTVKGRQRKRWDEE